MSTNEKKKYSPTRSFRIDPEVWDAARRRAETEGKNMSQVMQLLTEGYARGVTELPRVQTVFSSPK